MFNEFYNSGIPQETLLLWTVISEFYPWTVYLLLSILTIGLISVFIIYALLNKREKKNYHKLLNDYQAEMEKGRKELDDIRKQRVELNRLLTEGLLVIDENWVVYHANYQAFNLLGKSADELMFHKLPDWFRREVEAGIGESLEFTPSLDKYAVIQIFPQSGTRNLKTIWKYFPTEEGKPGAAILLQDYQELLGCHSKIQTLIYEKNEINKQLNCLFDICDICGVPDITLEGVFQKALSIIPNGLKFTNDVWVEITFNGERYVTANYIDTPWHFDAPIKVDRLKAGNVKVGYLNQHPKHIRDVFHLHEKLLIKNIAEKLGQTASLFLLRDKFNGLQGQTSAPKKRNPPKT